MPRVLKADLITENERLREELAKYKSVGQEQLTKPTRDRSRSPRTPRQSSDNHCVVVGSAASTRRALELVCHLERDEVIQEQRETIAKQQQEIQSLMDGDGPIGHVLMAVMRKHYPTCLSNYRIERLSQATTPVRDVVHRLEKLSSHTNDLLNWGESHWDRYQRL